MSQTIFGILYSYVINVKAKHNTLSLKVLNTHQTVNMDLSEVVFSSNTGIVSSTPPPSPKAHILSSPEPKRRRTSSSDNSVEQGEPSSAQARNATLNWSAYPKMIQRWIEMGNVPSLYFCSTSSSSTLPSLPCTMEQAFADFVFIITKELKAMKEATDDHDVGGILERVTHLEAQLQVADHAAKGLRERVTHLEDQPQATLFLEDVPLSDEEEEPFEEEPLEDEPLEKEPPEEEPVEIDDAQSYVSFDDEDV
ncbi:hypothetical protein L1987_78057 [Smallanthus sonchifolius]|uniref:Uncharacterized protein n=1 Tax=Smallanthus sonchifolius TaxID=185202 RepID=A0ACB8ZAT4_9ASTR|nr:hypothetical protein L1987_78057 [Smallanthus sonchifolius]